MVSLPAHDIQTLSPAVLAFDSGCTLGESVVWCDRQRALWWTDINARRIWRAGIGDASGQWWSTPGRVGSLALCESGRLLLGMEDGLYLADPAAQPAESRLLCERRCDVPTASPSLRVNDGRLDRSGNFVFGMINEDPARARTGHFYQYAARHGLRRLALDPVAIANGICFDPEGTTMYYCDSLQRQIMQVDYDAETAVVTTPRVFAVVEGDAEPDGATIDAHGNLWSARWGAGQVVCHAPGGEVLSVLPVPARQPTCVAFAGDGLATLFITSAREGLQVQQIEAHPGNGAVFRADLAGVHGLPDSRFVDA